MGQLTVLKTRNMGRERGMTCKKDPLPGSNRGCCGYMVCILNTRPPDTPAWVTFYLWLPRAFICCGCHYIDKPKVSVYQEYAGHVVSLKWETFCSFQPKRNSFSTILRLLHTHGHYPGLSLLHRLQGCPTQPMGGRILQVWGPPLNRSSSDRRSARGRLPTLWCLWPRRTPGTFHRLKSYH